MTVAGPPRPDPGEEHLSIRALAERIPYAEKTIVMSQAASSSEPNSRITSPPHARGNMFPFPLHARVKSRR
jgi:hypothetical protein